MDADFSFLETTRIGSAKVLLFGTALMFALLAGLLLDAKPAHAADIRVNRMDDAGDFVPGDGQCSTEAVPVGTRGPCTLRAAIEEANANHGTSDKIDFSSGLSGTITLNLGKLVIANDNTSGPDLSIEGLEGSRLSVSGNNDSGVFEIANSDATIDRITITGGSSAFDSGAVI
jgi:Bacterial Ig-like domain